MATTSDHIQADIARTRARMSTTLDRATSTSQGGSATLVESLTEQIRQRPIAAIGLTLLAGSLLQDYLSSSQGSSGGSAARSGGGSSPMQASGTARQVTRNVGVGAANALEQAGDAVTGAAGAVVDTTANAASTVANTAANAAGTVADTASNVAGAVADTTSNVARQVADTTGDVVNQVVDTAGDAYEEVSERAGTLWTTLSHQAQERPLTTLGVAIASGMLLQPTLAPRVSAITQSISAPVRTLSRSITQTVALTPPPEVDQIRETFVPVAVDRARQLTSRDLRDYLDRSLSGLVGQSSLRAGLVAAVTERAEGVVDSRLADILNRNLTGSRGLLVLTLMGAILRARSEVQQGQAQQTLTQVKTNVAQSLTQTARDQLMQFFPEFRQRFQSAQGAQQRCSNCNSVIPAGAHFCPQCGTPAPAQAPAAQAV